MNLAMSHIELFIKKIKLNVMNIRKIFLLLNIVLLNGLFTFGQTVIKDEYEFPIKQGTKEWEQFEKIEDRIAALQIPDVVLKKLSTESLLETCLKFPYLTDIFFYDNYQLGFEALMNEFNGFQELIKRSDLINVLIKKSQNFKEDVRSIRLQNDIEIGRFSFRHFVLGFMLAQDIVLENLSLEQEKQLILLSTENKNIKKSYSDIFGNWTDIPVNLFFAKIIINDPNLKFESDEQKKALSDFIQSPAYILDQRIIGFVEDFVNVKFK